MKEHTQDPWQDEENQPGYSSDDKKKIVMAYHQTFNSASGQAVLDDLKKAYGNRSSFSPGDSHRTAFREGQRDVYLRIIKLLADLATTGNSATA